MLVLGDAPLTFGQNAGLFAPMSTLNENLLIQNIIRCNRNLLIRLDFAL